MIDAHDASLAPGGDPYALHELAHHAGHTLLVLGGPAADPAGVLELARAIESEDDASPMVDAVIGLCADPPSDAIGRLSPKVAGRLGIDGITVLAVRPDRYVGLRHDGTDAQPLREYLEALTA